MVIFLIISTLLSVIATGVIIFTGLQSTQEKTSTQSRAADVSAIPTPLSSPTPITLPSPTPVIQQASPSASPVKIVISPYITATASGDKKSIFINFLNLFDAKSAFYKLAYSSLESTRSAQGNIIFQFSDKNLSREIILGVCSGATCTYDTGIKDIKIEVKFTLKDETTSQITYPYSL